MALTLPAGEPGRCPTKMCGHVIDDHVVAERYGDGVVYRCTICPGSSLCRTEQQQPPRPQKPLPDWVDVPGFEDLEIPTELGD
jgi:hypothetical protein